LEINENNTVLKNEDSSFILNELKTNFVDQQKEKSINPQGKNFETVEGNIERDLLKRDFNPFDLQGNKILIVDDEEVNRKILMEILDFHGFITDEAKDGIDCLKKLESTEFNLIILDIKMPNLDGNETLEILKKNNPYLPVIMVSGHASNEEAINSVKKGAFDFLFKPIDYSRLLITIRNALDKRKLLMDVGEFNMNEHNSSDYFIHINVPKELKIAIQQYLFYFKKFVFDTKGFDLDINIIDLKSSLKLILKTKDSTLLPKVSNWFNEYVRFAYINLKKENIQFENNISGFRKESIIKELKMQITHLNNSIELINEQSQLLKSENDFLKKITLNLTTKSHIKIHYNDNFFNRLKNNISEGKSIFVINEMIKICESNELKEIKNNFINLKAQLNKVIREAGINIISKDEERVEINRINHIVLELIDVIIPEIEDGEKEGLSNNNRL